jgi:8-oxo-dGTP pyrophosphatase MutT (NUDIX family)
MSDLPPPIPAATLILMRPAAGDGPPEILMLERTRTMAFAAGALVFPGGRVDPEDHEAAALLAPEHEDGAARIAAIRETIEESGLAPALAPSAGGTAAQALRDGLIAGEPFADLVDRHGLSIDADALVPYARWCPNFRETRRFDARFYLAEAPPGEAEASIHAPEAVRIFWASAEAILAEIAAGEAHAIFPTRRNLERLARYGSFADARADRASRRPRLALHSGRSRLSDHCRAALDGASRLTFHPRRSRRAASRHAFAPVVPMNFAALQQRSA